jgi:hypothetical protein
MKSQALLLVGLLSSLSAPAWANLTVTGTVRYVDRLFTYTGGFTGAEPELPVRFANVRVINSSTGAILASGVTSEAGDFSISVVGSGSANLQVRIEAQTNQFGASARVTDSASVLYTVSSPVFANWNLSQNLNVGTVVSTKLTAAGRVGNPFNMLDQMVSGMQWIQANGGAGLPQSVRCVWPGGSGSFASGSTFTMSDDDGYDDTVQLHEFGHVVHNLYSDSDSPGGSHTFGESDQDPRLSFGEGWATAFAGAIRNRDGGFDTGFYMDCSGSGANGSGTIQLRMRLENGTPYQNSTRGEANEGAVHCSLYDLFDTNSSNDSSPGSDDDPINGTFLFSGNLTGDQLAWRSLDGPVQSASNLTIRDFWNGLFSPGNPGSGSQLAAVFEAWRIRVLPDANEPNNTFASAVALPVFGNWTALRTLYSPAPGATAPGEGDSDYYLVNLVSETSYEFETRYPEAYADAGTYADVSLRLWRPDGSLAASDNDSGVGLNAALLGQIANQTGAWRIEVYTQHPYRRTGGYELRVRQSAADCNGNGLDDAAEIAAGSLLDLDANGTPDICQPLSANKFLVSLVPGGTQTLSLNAGAAQAGRPYLMLGSLSGTSPGLPLGSLLLPLNYDSYTDYLLLNPGAPPVAGGLGTLDALGKGTASFSLPPASPLGLFGLTGHHAFLVIGPTLDVVFTSNAMPVFITLL